jgi:tight adherence protein C
VSALAVQLLGLAALACAALSAGLLARALWDARLRRVAAARAAGDLGAARGRWDLGRWAKELIARRTPPIFSDGAQAWLKAQGRPVELAPGLIAQSLGLALLGLGLGSLLGAGLLSPAFALAGVLPWLKQRDAGALRRRQIARSLPEALDLLTACVQAGLGLDPALQRVGAALPEGPFREELRLTLEALRLGQPRREAFLALEARCGVPELGAVLRALLRSESRGIPLAPMLAGQSAQLRRLRSLAVQKAAAQAPVKMLLPLMGFILPVVFLVLFGPILLKLGELGF